MAKTRLRIWLFKIGSACRITLVDNIISNTSKVFRLIRSGYITANFKSVGKSPYLQSPVRIIGDKYISIGDNFSSLYNLRLEAYDRFREECFSPVLEIGNNVVINTDCHFACINKLKVGDNVLIASRVFITDHYHGAATSEYIGVAPKDRRLFSKGSVIIGNDVWIGEGVAIMPNVEIGEGSIIGANAVVTTSFPPYSVIGGIPAKLIRSLK